MTEARCYIYLSPAKYQLENGKMFKTKNSDLIKEIILLIITIAGRRTSETVASAFMEAVLKTLERKYRFLKYIQIENVAYFEGHRSGAIHIKEQKVDSVDESEVGRAIESMIRVLCLDLEEDTGLFFIKEVKDNLDEKYLVKLRKCGVDLELLKLEQRHLFEQLEKKKSFIHSKEETADSEFKVEVPNYSWKEVKSFKYRNNVCFLYDKNGKLLDRLHVSKIIEYYVRTLTNFGKLVLKKDKVELTEKQLKLLALLNDRDLDEESAKHMLNATNAELNYIIHQLLRYEYLQYVSYDEIRITEKGIRTVEEKRAVQKVIM